MAFRLSGLALLGFLALHTLRSCAASATQQGTPAEACAQNCQAGEDGASLSLLQTASQTATAEARRAQSNHSRISSREAPVAASLPCAVTAAGCDPVNQAPCIATPGGGCQGGYDVSPTGAVVRAPAPPNHFPSGCQWQSPKRIALVHVGKCAGGSLRNILYGLPINFTHIHMGAAPTFYPEDFDLFIVAVRDAVPRAISAFNFARKSRVRRLALRQFCRFWSPFTCSREVQGLGEESQTETTMHDCFPESPGALNQFAEALSDNTTCGALARACIDDPYQDCGHLAKGVHYYVQDDHGLGHPTVISVLQNSPNKHAFVVPSDNFGNASKALQDWLCVPPNMQLAPTEKVHNVYALSNDTHVSDEGHANIASHTALDASALQAITQLADPW